MAMETEAWVACCVLQRGSCSFCPVIFWITSARP